MLFSQTPSKVVKLLAASHSNFFKNKIIRKEKLALFRKTQPSKLSLSLFKMQIKPTVSKQLKIPSQFTETTNEIVYTTGQKIMLSPVRLSDPFIYISKPFTH